METLGDGIRSGGESDKEREEEAQETAAILRDRLRLSVISIASSHAKTLGMTISEPVVSCIADLAFKQAEQMGRDVELFAQHAGRKSVNVEDVILSAHRNEHLMGLLRDFAQDLKGKEPCTEKKRKKKAKKKKASKNGNKVQEPIEMLD